MTFKNLFVVLVGIGLSFMLIGFITGCEGWVVISVNKAPVAAISANPIQGYAKLQVNFDASGSYDPDGQIVSYYWDFGDGTTGSGVTVNHLYEDDSDFNNDGYNEGYTVTLTVTDNDGATDKSQVVIYVDNPAPVAHFSFSPSNPYTFDEVIFDASASYDPAGIIIQPSKIISYYWDFGDGSYGEGMITTHSYEDNGSYQITLTVTDDDGATSLSSQWIEVRNQNPVAKFTWGPCPTSLLSELALEGIVPEPTQVCLQFDASSSYDPDGYIVEYRWTVKDQWGEAQKRGKIVSYILERGYRYAVTLTVTDDDGASVSRREYIDVY